MTSTGLPIVRDGEHRMSRTHWEVVHLPGEKYPLAVIMDSTETVMLTLGCSAPELMLVGPEKGSHFDDPDLALSWDGDRDSEPLLQSFDTSSWGFALGQGESGFDTAIARLKQHHTLEATVSADGTEPLRYGFALAQADKAIDHVLGVCNAKS